MLAPDVAETKAALTGVKGAMEKIDQYVTSIQSQHYRELTFAEFVNMSADSREGYAELKASVEKAQEHAKQWNAPPSGDSLSTTLRSTIFGSTKSFGTAFQERAETMLNLLATGRDGDLFPSLMADLEILKGNRITLEKQKEKLAAFARDMTADSNSLASDGGLIQQGIDAARAWPAKMDKIERNPRDPSEERRHHAANVAKADELIAALTKLAEKFSGWESLSEAAHTSIDNLATIWEGLEGHYQELIDTYPTKQVSKLVLKGEIKAAQEAWKSLTLFISDEIAPQSQ